MSEFACECAYGDSSYYSSEQIKITKYSATINRGGLVSVAGSGVIGKG